MQSALYLQRLEFVYRICWDHGGSLFATCPEFLVVIYQGERKRDVQRVGLVRRGGTFARFEAYHQVHPARGTLVLESLHEIGPKDLPKESFKLDVDTYSDEI